MVFEILVCKFDSQKVKNKKITWRLSI